MAVNRYDDTRAWYAISTYSGYEDKVAESILQRINTIEMANKIFDAIVPKEKQIEIKNGKRKVVDRKIFQGYVLVEMKLSDETWYIIRNTRGVTGFVGPDGRPVPLTEDEVIKLGVEKRSVTVEYEVGDLVTVIGGSFDGFSGIVDNIDIENDTVRVIISMMGRDTPLELGLDQVESAVD